MLNQKFGGVFAISNSDDLDFSTSYDYQNQVNFDYFEEKIWIMGLDPGPDRKPDESFKINHSDILDFDVCSLFDCPSRASAKNMFRERRPNFPEGGRNFGQELTNGEKGVTASALLRQSCV